MAQVNLMDGGALGEGYRSKGYRPNYPMIVVPGLCSTQLKVVESDYGPWVGKRLWLDTTMIGMGAMLDGLPLFGGTKKKKKSKTEKKMSSSGDMSRSDESDKKKKSGASRFFSKRIGRKDKSASTDEGSDKGRKKKTSNRTTSSSRALNSSMSLSSAADLMSTPPSSPQTPQLSSSTDDESIGGTTVVKDMETGEDIEMANVDPKTRRRWINHVVLQEDCVSDPPGIKVRNVKGIEGCSYLDPGLKAFSYVWGPFLECFQAIGYTDENLRAATYDWRMPPCMLEKRDGFFTEWKEMVDDMHAKSERKVVICAHSLGTRCAYYFLRWCEHHFGRKWLTEKVYSWIAVGPLFLGAPKSIRGIISGERMGLDAFLFPQEGVMLCRRVGSSPWMFPILTTDYDLTAWAKVKDARTGEWIDHSIEEVMHAGGADHIWASFDKNYLQDPIHGNTFYMTKPPPVDRLFAIYGINLKTETFYFYKKSTAKNPVTTLELDPSGQMAGYKCENGIAYETKATPQAMLRGEPRSGDGTVPYVSMAHCKNWMGRDDIKVEVCELEKSEHRDILKDKRFINKVIEYICFEPPPLLLPESFPDLQYEVNVLSTAGKQTKTSKMNVSITRSGVDLKSRKGEVKNSYGYLQFEAVEVDAENANQFTAHFEGKKSSKTFTSDFTGQIVQEISARSRYVKMLLTSQNKTGVREARDEHGQTELHRAAFDGKLSEVQELLKRDPPVDVNAVDRNGWTPLHCAASNQHLVIVNALLGSSDIEVNMVSKDGTSPFHYLIRLTGASCGESNASKQEAFAKEVVRVWAKMMQKGANINLYGQGGDTPLHTATMRGNMMALNWLADHKANLNSANNNGETPFHYAVRSRSEEIIKWFLDKGADQHKKNKDGKTALGEAKETSKELFALMCGVTVDELGMDDANYGVQDEYGQTPLHRAALDGRMDTVYQLVFEGADVNCADRNGFTAMHNAASRGHIKVLETLLQNPTANVNLLTKDKTSVMHYLCRLQPEGLQGMQDCERVWNAVLARKGDLNKKDRHGETPLHQAVSRSNMLAATWLVKNGARINATNQLGETALHYAVRNNNFDMVALIVDYEPDINIPSKKGELVKELATKAANPKILDCIKEYEEREQDEEPVNATPTPKATLGRQRAAPTRSSSGSGDASAAIQGALASKIKGAPVEAAVEALKQANKELHEREFEGEALGGIVRITISGAGEVKKADVQTIAMGDPNVASAMIASAFNNAFAKLDAARKERAQVLKKVLPSTLHPLIEELLR